MVIMCLEHNVPETHPRFSVLSTLPIPLFIFQWNLLLPCGEIMRFVNKLAGTYQKRHFYRPFIWMQRFSGTFLYLQAI